MQFFSVLTELGLNKLAQAPQQQLVLTHMAVGDGGGDSYDPTKEQLIESTELVNEVYRQEISSGGISVEDNTFEVRVNIPNDQGGWWVREVGVFDTDGDMVAVAKVAPFFKPISIIGVDRETVVRIIVAVSNAEQIIINVTPVPDDEVESVDISYGLKAISGTSYTLSEADNGQTLWFTNDSDITVTLPGNDLPMDKNINCAIIQAGEGTITLQGASGVNVRSEGDLYSSAEKYSPLSLIRVSQNEWWLGGHRA